MKPISLVSFLLLCYQLSFAQSTYKATVYFDTDSHVLTKESEGELSPHLATPNITAIQIEGHTDNEGNTEYNRQLSQRRANAVKDYLIQYGISTDVIAISFFGEDAPITENLTEVDKSLNRRVEVTFNYAPVIVEASEPVVEEIPEPVIETVETPVAPPKPTLVDNTELYETLAKQVPTFYYTINNNRDTMLKLPSGALLYFGANIFDLPNENYREKINLKITEYSKPSHAVLGNVTTLSNGKLLYSAGMFNIMAFCNNEPVELEKGKTYKIFFPIAATASGNTEKFKGFYGEKDSLNQEVNWTQAPFRDFEMISGQTTYTLSVCDGGGDYGMGNNYRYKEKKYGFFMRIFRPRKVRELKRKDRERAAQRYRASRVLKDTNSEIVCETFDRTYDYMYLSAAGFGYINCDRFWKVPANKRTNILVDIPKEVNAQIFMVFKSRKSIMRPNSTDGNYGFNHIPKNEEVWLIGAKLLDDGKMALGLKSVNTSDEVVDIELQSFDTEEEFQEAMEKING